MKRISTLFAAALCLAALAPAKADYLSMDMFGHSIKLMVDGYTGTETLTNFPVLVRLAEYDETAGTGIEGFRYSDLTNNKGKDIAFFDELGNHLASEIQTNDWTTSGESLVWVSLPRMQQGTKFYLCYNTEASGVWVTNQNPWTDYVGVWHLDESGGENKPVFDSTTNRLHGVNRSTSGSVVSSGAIGKARKIANSNAHDPGIIVDTLSDPVKQAAADSLGTDFHASFWMSPQGNNTTNRKWSNLLGRRKGDKGQSWGVSIDDDAKGLRLYADGTQTAKNDQQRFVSTYRDTGHGLTTTAVPPTISNQFPFLDTQGGWYKIDVLWKYTTAENNACYEVYSNGVLAAAGVLIGPVSNVPANIGIGCSTQDAYGSSPAEKKGRRFYGDMDEVRLRPGIVSADWIKADFDTVNNKSFVTLAPPEVLEVAWAEESGRSGVTNVAWNAAAVGGIVTGLGPGATEATIEGKFWADGENEPATWTVLADGLVGLDAFEAVVSCAENTTYHYKLRAVDDASGETDPVTGTFATPLGLAVTWAEVPGRVGVTNVLGHGVVIGGSIGCLGDSATVSVEGKFWENGGEEPSAWTSVVGPLAQASDFSVLVSNLVVDTLYRYKLRVAGSNGNATEPVSGTFTTSHGLTVSWAGSAEQPGVTNVAWNAAVVGGIVEALGDVASCTIEGKFWAGETEPAEWSSLSAGRGEGAFSIQIPNLSENTTYHYKLRATETDGSETPVASGSFTTPVGLAVSWADDVSGRPGVTAVGVFSATVGGSVECLGDSATCTVEGKFWSGETEPETWTPVGTALSQTGAFTATVSGLAGGTAYSYKLRLAGSNGAATAPVSGTFTTVPSLTVAWSTATSSAGIASLGYGFVAVGGQVTALGEATSCAVQAKIWVAGGTEPEWTTLKESLGLNGTFSVNVPGLEAGTTYRYELRAVGNDGEVTSLVSSSFTTPGESGEELGSDYTEFFDDGTNAVWIAKGFERYLPFTVTGYTGTETLTNFPVLVEVRGKDTNGFSYDDFYHYDGADIVFVDEKGHIIPHEIDTWNKGGMSLFWVRLPEMVNGTTFTMCYRSPLLETPPDPGNVFEKYVGVWHMSEKGDGVVNLKDSTVNDFETETHAQSLYNNNGRIGGARQVAQNPGSAASYGRIIAFDHDDILRTGVGNVFTYSGWYKLLEQPPKWAYLVSRKSEDADRGWGVQYQETGTAQLRVWSGSRSKSGFNGQTFSFSNTGTDWHYWTFVFDGNGPFGPGTNGLFYAYLDGEIVKSVANGLPLKFDIANDETADYDNLCVVGQQNGTGAFKGLVDEARYSKGIRSADWIKAEYLSTMQAQWWNTDKRFVTKGTVSRGEDSLVPVVVWERGDGLPDTILDVSYAYVQFAGTVTYCGSGAEDCRIEYQLWADGEEQPEDWTTLLDGATAGTAFSIPVTGLKQDMLYNFRIRAVAEVDGQERQNHEHAGQFRTNGNLDLGNVDGELLRVGDKFVHRYRAGSWTFTTPDYVTNIEIMVVGGGGAGGYKVGGGGGGGLFHSESFPVTTSTVYRVSVGQGGTAPTDVATHSVNGNGENSYFALASDEAHPLILVPGGGGGGSYANDADVATGADGASGGGGTYAKLGGTATDDGVYGHDGGRGNDFLQGGAIGKVAAGGGGGAGRVGLGATFDSWSTGGSGGVGVANSMTGETLFYGAGGGGGYIYRDELKDGNLNFSKPGGGGSGIGGNAADVRNGTPATSGVENTGAGGGGGSSRGQGDGKTVDESDSTYWRGGDGGDGVVLISYEAHGRDPISEEPRITMTRCDYISKEMIANINYRAYWAGIQAQTNDIYVLYSTVSEEDVAAGNGEMVKVAIDTIGIGSTTFTPPAVGFTYWVRLVARKNANSFMYSDEIASFEVPAVEVNGTDPKMPFEDDPSRDYAEITYNLFDTAPDARLYCYWSENRADLEGDAAPTGSTVHFLDLGTGRAGEGKKFTIYAADGIERNKSYYVRLATGNEAGTKYFLSKQIVLLEMIDKPRVIFDDGVWNNHKATVDFHLTTATLDPAEVDLVALYSGIEADVKADPAKTNLLQMPGMVVVNLGSCANYPDDMSTSTQFPMWSPVDTNFYVRLALTRKDITETDGVAVTNVVPVCYSQRYHTLTTITAVPANTLLIYANADAQIGCYGDEPPEPLTYTLSYGGLTEGPGWEHWQSAGGSLTGALACAATSLSPTGQYDIVQGTLGLSDGGQAFINSEQVFDPETGEPVLDENNDPVYENVTYNYMLVYTGSKYTVTNAQFTVSIADTSTPYTGEPFDDLGLVVTTNGLRNDQPITFLYRVGTNDWSGTITTTYSEIWTHIIQFKASAPNHDDARGTFMITIEPAPLTATISAADMGYTGAAQVPTVTTNVYGHKCPELNPLTSEFRDESSEWTTEIPSFTLPGTYKLFYRVSASNHTTFTTNCTFTIEAWDYKVNMDGYTGYNTPIHVSDPGWLLDVTGLTSVDFATNRYAILDGVCTNGLKLWQNYVIERNDLGQKLVAAVRQSGSRVDANAFVVYFPGVAALRNTGLNVNYRLDRKLKGATEFTQGALSDKYEMNVPLGPNDPTGLYVFNMVLTSTNQLLYPGEAVLASCATVGVLRVSSAAPNTVTAAPWMSMDTEEEANEPITVSEAVNPNGLTAGTRADEGDRILVYDASDDTFRSWAYAGGRSWTSSTTVKKSGELSSSDANTTTLEPGTAFWLVRNDPSSGYFYLVGRYVGDTYEVPLEGGTADAPGYTLVANPTMDEIGMNELAFVDGEGAAATPAATDRIVVQDAAGNQRIHIRNAANTAWGRNATKRVNGRLQQVWVDGGPVPAGTGFWYVRTAAEPLFIRFGGAE